MALDPKAQAALALYRFGLGPRAGSIAGIASDPRGALLAELDGAGAGRIGNADLLTSGTAAAWHSPSNRRSGRRGRPNAPRNRPPRRAAALPRRR